MTLRFSRRGAMLCVLGFCATCPKPGHADVDAKRRCVRAYEDAQTSKREGKLLDAKDKLLLCSSAQCPEVMHRDCQRWHDEVEASIPTLVFRAETSTGSPISLASASLDGAGAIALDGRAVSLDPGRHTVRFSAQGYLPQAKTLDVFEGEKLRREIVVLAPLPAKIERPHPAALDKRPAPTPDTEPETQSHLTLPIAVSASVAVLGGASATYFGVKARAGEEDLRTCSPHCTQERVEGVKRDYVLANASIGLAAAGLIVTTVLFVFEFRTPNRTHSARLGLHTAQHQLSLSLGGKF